MGSRRNARPAPPAETTWHSGSGLRAAQGFQRRRFTCIRTGSTPASIMPGGFLTSVPKIGPFLRPSSSTPMASGMDSPFPSMWAPRVYSSRAVLYPAACSRRRTRLDPPYFSRCLPCSLTCFRRRIRTTPTICPVCVWPSLPQSLCRPLSIGAGGDVSGWRSWMESAPPKFCISTSRPRAGRFELAAPGSRYPATRSGLRMKPGVRWRRVRSATCGSKERVQLPATGSGTASARSADAGRVVLHG